jgi:DNA-binding MarR family transcriptional regulator
MHAVNQMTVKSEGYVRSIEISLPQGHFWKDLVIDKMEPNTNSHIFISILDGVTNEPISGFEDLTGSIIDLTSIHNVSHGSIKVLAIFAGDGLSTPKLNEWKITWDDGIISSSTPSHIPGGSLTEVAVLVTAVTSAFLIIIAGGTEVGKYRTLPVIIPMYTRLKKREVLGQLTRWAIFEYIMGHPGDHYNSIKRKLNVNNGALAYHLKTLESGNFIKSMRDGIYKRFYPIDADIPRVNGFGIQSVHGQILLHVIQNPGLTQKEISKALNISQQVASYNLNLMMEMGHIWAERQDNIFRYYVDENDLQK